MISIRKLDDDKGTTRVLCHSPKGADLIQEVKEYAKCEEVSSDKLVAGVKEMFESVPMNPKRTVFMTDAANLSGKELFEKYYPVTNKVKVKNSYSEDASSDWNLWNNEEIFKSGAREIK